jgi:hypothetical protein
VTENVSTLAAAMTSLDVALLLALTTGQTPEAKHISPGEMSVACTVL